MKKNEILLSDYRPHDYRVETIDLTMHLLEESNCKVVSKMCIYPQYEGHNEFRPLVLNGEQLKILSIKINGQEIPEKSYRYEDDLLTLTIHQWEKDGRGNPCLIVDIENQINPKDNQSLDGLYLSSGMYCTQNEPEGFRRITFFIDRPDNMSFFSTKIIAPKKNFPVLLSNGNLIAEGDLDGGLHFKTWKDPFKKPCYLYALVAGDLGWIEDRFTTKSGRLVRLIIYCDKGNEGKCHHGMESLKKSMKWDEERYGLEYDLDIYMIVAVDAFNMGAMENKGLNIFNSAFILADQKTSTDKNFYDIESVIAHEYFHNWTGNRVTCRDWFQLTLKEGLTVYRDQEFSADLNARSVERIDSVNRLKMAQFSEDQGPNAHPIKPKSYIEINNFYTATIYEKGAEVIRMVEILLGRDGFRKGMDCYFELFDGKAVRTEDFIFAMSKANGNYDFSQFMRWYDFYGTPVVRVKTNYDAQSETLAVTFHQSNKNSSNPEDLPMIIPIRYTAYDQKSGKALVNCKHAESQSNERIMVLKKSTETFYFHGVKEEPIFSFNQNFSAPIRLINEDFENSDQHLYFLLGNDTDPVNKQDALNRIYFHLIGQYISTIKMKGKNQLPEKFLINFKKVLLDETLDPQLKALLLELPSIDLIFQEQSELFIEETCQAMDELQLHIAEAFETEFVQLYKNLSDQMPKSFDLSPRSMGMRALKGKVLNYLLSINVPEKMKSYSVFGVNEFMTAPTMTERFTALYSLVHHDHSQSKDVLEKFYQEFSGNKLVMQKWMSVIASHSHESTLNQVLTIEKDPVYDQTIPNCVRALVGAFANNKREFHHASGRGYQFLGERIVKFDSLNPQLASRLSTFFKDYKKLDPKRKSLVKIELEKIMEKKDLSKNVFEIISKTLNN